MSLEIVNETTEEVVAPEVVATPEVVEEVAPIEVAAEEAVVTE